MNFARLIDALESLPLRQRDCRCLLNIDGRRPPVLPLNAFKHVLDLRLLNMPVHLVELKGGHAALYLRAPWPFVAILELLP